MKPISLILSSAIAFFASSSYASTHVFDWNVTWATANPSGLKDRKVIGINGKWPLPTVDVNKGDRVIFNVYNDLGDRNTSVHFHGMYQNGTNAMDGPAKITQCPIPPGGSFTYNFTVDQNGTYWYHSHVSGQYPDGYRGAFIVHDKDAYFAKDFDEELTFTLSDWYDTIIDTLDKQFLNLYNPSGAEPVPNHLIFNESQNVSVSIKPNTTYLIHIMNIAALGSTYFWIEGHKFTIVEVDGVYTEPTEAEILYITPAQRYAILLTTKAETDKNYAIATVFDSSMFDVIPPELTLNQTNWLEYNPSAPHNPASIPYESSDDITAFDDMNLIPADRKTLYPEPDVEITLDVIMNNLLNGVNYAFFNNITYTEAQVPTLYTVMSSPDELLNNPTIYGEYTNPFVLGHMQVVQIVVNNVDSGTHPFHMHGHEFQVISRSDAYEDDDPTPFDPNNHEKFPKYPLRRDTAHVKPNGNMVIRFIADNPGVWLFHCHLEWHLEQGLALVLVEAPSEIKKHQSVPQSHYEMCAAAHMPYKGNAASNVDDFLDLTGQNSQVADLPPGFTFKGVFALILSCFAAFAGTYFIVSYGLTDIPTTEASAIKIVQQEELAANRRPNSRNFS